MSRGDTTPTPTQHAPSCLLCWLPCACVPSPHAACTALWPSSTTHTHVHTPNTRRTEAPHCHTAQTQGDEEGGEGEGTPHLLQAIDVGVQNTADDFEVRRGDVVSLTRTQRHARTQTHSQRRCNGTSTAAGAAQRRRRPVPGHVRPPTVRPTRRGAAYSPHTAISGSLGRKGCGDATQWPENTPWWKAGGCALCPISADILLPISGVK